MFIFFLPFLFLVIDFRFLFFFFPFFKYNCCVQSPPPSTGEMKTSSSSLVSSCPEGALRVKPGLNSLKNALKEAKENGIKEIFLENGVHTIEIYSNWGAENSVRIDFPVTIIGESKDGCTIIGGLWVTGKKEDDVNVKTLTISQSKKKGVYGDGGMSFHLFNLNIEKSWHGVYVLRTKRNTMSNCQVSHSKESGVLVNGGGLITMNGSGTSIHNNVTGGDSWEYGLNTFLSSSIHLVSPLTIESVSINNGGGGNYGGAGTIKTIEK